MSSHALARKGQIVNVAEQLLGSKLELCVTSQESPQYIQVQHVSYIGKCAEVAENMNF